MLGNGALSGEILLHILCDVHLCRSCLFVLPPSEVSGRLARGKQLEVCAEMESESVMVIGA